ncbi:hypothetical protein WMO40_12415 [Bacillaceae bacterium CLA-AA-H227]|uniref:Uncharacterized protein n=1 Tax=Robertmurraya yapensis (ex Hitch et al 2024) TaxID=3133160 RepID=A0ACC6SCC1_9BACI
MDTLTIVQETQQTYYEYINQVEKGCLQISEYLRTEQISEALNTIIQFSEGIVWLLQVEELMNKNGFSMDSLIHKANEFLNEINQALEIRDYVFVADLFEYELNPLFKEQALKRFSEI